MIKARSHHTTARPRALQAEAEGARGFAHARRNAHTHCVRVLRDEGSSRADTLAEQRPAPTHPHAPTSKLKKEARSRTSAAAAHPPKAEAALQTDCSKSSVSDAYTCARAQHTRHTSVENGRTWDDISGDDISRLERRTGGRLRWDRRRGCGNRARHPVLHTGLARPPDDNRAADAAGEGRKRAPESQQLFRCE